MNAPWHYMKCDGDRAHLLWGLCPTWGKITEADVCRHLKKAEVRRQRAEGFVLLEAALRSAQPVRKDLQMGIRPRLNESH